MAKIVCYGEEVRHVLEHGASQLVDTVKTTMGPRGRNVVLDRKFGAPLVTSDDVAIAKETELDDPFESMGAQLVKEVSTKINDVADDGTITVTLLAQAIIHEDPKNPTVGVDPMVMKKGIVRTTTAAVKTIKVNSKKVNGSADIAYVGIVSSSDETVGKLIAEIMEKASHDGIITVEESETTEAYSEATEGIRFDRGYITSYMVTDAEKVEAALDDALILITDEKTFDIQELLPILKQVVQSGKKLLVIAENVEGEALSTLIVNRLHGTLNVVCVKTLGFDDRQEEILEDVAVLTSGTAIISNMGYKLKEVIMDMLGHICQVEASKENAIIVDGADSADVIEARANQIKSQIKTTTSNYDREKFQGRLAKVTDDVAIIRVDAAAGVETKEKKLRIESALNATRAAVKGGIVAGGGIVYVSAIVSVEELLVGTEGDEKTGVSTITRVLTEPMHQITTNAGIDGSMVLGNVKRADKVGYSSDAYNETYVDMVFVDAVDPTEVTRSALENAASIAVTLLTIGSLVADKPQSPAPAIPATLDMGGMY